MVEVLMFVNVCIGIIFMLLCGWCFEVCLWCFVEMDDSGGKWVNEMCRVGWEWSGIWLSSDYVGCKDVYI